MPAPDRAAARRLVLARLLAERPVRSQDELVGLLARHGHRVTQATVSRDLAALGVRKRTGPGGAERYAGDPPVDRDEASAYLARMLREFVTGIEHSGNLVVLKTPPGAAHPVASALDAAPPRGVLGTVAGDDTVLVVAENNNGSRVARRLAGLLEVTSR